MRTLATYPTIASPSPEAESAAPLPKRRAKSAGKRAPLSVKSALELVSEALWASLLFLVIAFLVWKMPQIDATIDDLGGGSHRAAPAAAASDPGQIRELENRIARYEAKLAPIERGYAELKQRHSDLRKAYDALRRASAPEAFAKPSIERVSVAAP